METIKKLRETYGLSAELLTEPNKWSVCLQRSHVGYVRFVRYFGDNLVDEEDCRNVAGLYLGRSEPVQVTSESALTHVLKETIHVEGFRVMNATKNDTEAAERLSESSRFKWYQEYAGYLREEATHWKAVKYVVKARFGDKPSYIALDLTNQISYKRSADMIAMKQLRKIYPHKGLNAFIEVVESKLHTNSDDEAVPCFLVNYLSHREISKMLQIGLFGKVDILRFVTSAIEQVEDHGRPLKYRVHQQVLAAAGSDVQDAFSEYSDTDHIEEYSHRPTLGYKQWPYAVAKAAILETSWILRDAIELKDVMQICGISLRVERDEFCRWVTTAFIRTVIPLWSADSFWDKDVYMEIVRAMSVAINVKYPMLWGPSRLQWEAKMFYYRIMLNYSN
jgi:hypothetical protein